MELNAFCLLLSWCGFSRQHVLGLVSFHKENSKLCEMTSLCGPVELLKYFVDFKGTAVPQILLFNCRQLVVITLWT